MNCVSTVVELIADFHHHALIYVETPGCNFVHDRATLSCIYQHETTHGLSDSDHAAVVVAGGALLVIDEQNFFIGLHCSASRP